MPSPAALNGISTVSLLANVAHDLICLVERKRLAGTKNPYTVLLPQARTSLYRPQRETFPFALEGGGYRRLLAGC